MVAAAQASPAPFDRFALETQFIADLRPIFAREFDRARHSPQVIPYGLFQQELVAVMAGNLFTAFQSAGAALIIGHSLIISQGAFEATGRQWAHGYALELAAKTVETSRFLAEPAVDRIMRESSPAESAARQVKIELTLAAIFMADSRLENIAITEVTRGLSAGENSVVLPFHERDRNDRLIAIWQCVEDAPGVPAESVCEVCAPFDRHGIEVWGRLFPDGPPAHPRCRCRRRWMRASEWARDPIRNAVDAMRRAAA
jgi:hypothetical protein